MIADIECPPPLFKISRSPPGTFSAEIESCLHFNTTYHTERNHIELSRTCSLSSFNLRMLSFLLFSYCRFHRTFLIRLSKFYYFILFQKIFNLDQCSFYLLSEKCNFDFKNFNFDRNLIKTLILIIQRHTIYLKSYYEILNHDILKVIMKTLTFIIIF